MTVRVHCMGLVASSWWSMSAGWSDGRMGGDIFLQSSSRKENRTQSPWHSWTLKKFRHQLPSLRDTDTVNCITVSCATLLLLSALPSCRSKCCWFLIGFLFYFLHTSSLYNLWSQKSFLTAVHPKKSQPNWELKCLGFLLVSSRSILWQKKRGKNECECLWMNTFIQPTAVLWTRWSDLFGCTWSFSLVHFSGCPKSLEKKYQPIGSTVHFLIWAGRLWPWLQYSSQVWLANWQSYVPHIQMWHLLFSTHNRKLKTATSVKSNTHNTHNTHVT